MSPKNFYSATVSASAAEKMSFRNINTVSVCLL